MTKETVVKLLAENGNAFYGYIFAEPYVLCSDGKSDWIEKEDKILHYENPTVCDSYLSCIIGGPGPDINLFWYCDYGITWGFRKDEIKDISYKDWQQQCKQHKRVLV